MELHAQHWVNGQALTVICKKMAGASLSETNRAPPAAPTWGPGASDVLAQNTWDTNPSSTCVWRQTGLETERFSERIRPGYCGYSSHSTATFLVSFLWVNGLPATGRCEESHLHLRYENPWGATQMLGLLGGSRSGDSKPKERGSIACSRPQDHSE